jgi:HEAT repeat protein
VGKTAVPALLRTLRDKDLSFAARVYAANALMRGAEPRAAEPMAAIALDSTDDIELRRSLAMYLGRLRSEHMLDVLIEVAGDDGADFEMRLNALHALGEMADLRAVPALRAMLEREDIRVVPEPVIRELERIEVMRREATGDLAAQYDDMIARVPRGRSLHWDVCQALRYIPDPSMLDLLMARLTTEEGDVRGSVATAVGSLGAIAALSSTKDPRVFEPLAEILAEDADSATRRQAAESLGYLGDERAIDPLVRALRDEDVRVRQAAAQGLLDHTYAGRCDVRILPELERVAERDEGMIYGQYVVRDAATRVLKEIKQRWSERT